MLAQAAANPTKAMLSTEQKKRDLELNLRREEDISAALQVNIDDLTAREVHLMDERDLTKRELVDVLRKLKEAHEAVADAQQEAAMAQSDRDTMRITLSEAQERHSSALMDVTHATAVAQQKERKIASLEASQKQMQEEIEAASDAAATSHTQYIELQRTASEQTRKNEVLTDEPTGGDGDDSLPQILFVASATPLVLTMIKWLFIRLVSTSTLWATGECTSERKNELVLIYTCNNKFMLK